MKNNSIKKTGIALIIGLSLGIGGVTFPSVVSNTSKKLFEIFKSASIELK
ncbi:hypothetical protein [Lentilactobacillus kefiri]|nr:hypothetical protein [Lentilactobacillus kefiri]MCJ2162897.1 hypothetical protein [Lentilactobacillus kefiri]MCP9370274.1 hypothetical protein [Lentilactobacillus kefiri]